jgi:hypothetical protein
LTTASQIDVVPRAFPGGALTPIRSFLLSATQGKVGANRGVMAADSEGNEVYFANGNNIAVYPSSSTGSPNPTRILQGSATTLYNVAGLTICN